MLNSLNSCVFLLVFLCPPYPDGSLTGESGGRKVGQISIAELGKVN